jgi:hypothetical protein
MPNKINISLAVPSSRELDRHITLPLKKSLCNELSEYKLPSRILAISDIEGNFLAFRRLLIKNKVINNKYKWTFEDGHVVIAGDCFDRGEQVIECLWLIYSLEEKAKMEGGHIHFILGNHEIMNMNGDWRYVHPKYAENAKSNKLPVVLYGGNSELWNWLRTKNIMEKIGNILFVHGGISEELLKLDLPIATINNRIRPFYTRANESFTDPLLNIVYNSSNSPFWYRGYYQSEIREELIDATIAHFGVNVIVTGHTITEKIKPHFGGKVINIDTDHASGNSEVLLIKKNHFYRIDREGKRERIK